MKLDKDNLDYPEHSKQREYSLSPAELCRRVWHSEPSTLRLKTGEARLKTIESAARNQWLLAIIKTTLVIVLVPKAMELGKICANANTERASANAISHNTSGV